MINQLLDPRSNSYNPLGWVLETSGASANKRVLVKLFNVIDNATDSVDRIDQPYVWVYAHYFLTYHKLLRKLECVQLGYDTLNSAETKECMLRLKELDETFEKDTVECINRVKETQHSGLYFSVVFNSLLSALENRLQENGVTPNMDCYDQIKDCYWVWAMEYSGVNVSTAMLTWNIDICSAKPLTSDNAMIAENMLPMILKATDRLKEEEAMAITATPEMSVELRNIIYNF